MKILWAAILAAVMTAAVMAVNSHQAVEPSASIVQSFSKEPLYAGGNTIYAVDCQVAGCPRNVIWKSTDDGVSWQTCPQAMANRVETMTPTATGALLISTDSGTKVWRSEDGCQHWTLVFSLPQTPYRYQLLDNNSIAADDQYVYIGAYNQSTAQRNNTNYVWRSADDGRAWQVAFVNTTWKHIHALATYGNKVYLFSGDNTGCTAATLSTCTDGIYQADKGGENFTSFCIGRVDHFCIDLVGVPNDDALYVGTDLPVGTNNIVKVDKFTGAPMSLKQVPYELGSGVKLADGAVVMGTWFEPGHGIKPNEPNLHVYIIVNDVAKAVLDLPIVNANAWGYLDVKGVLDDGNVVIERSGYGGYTIKPFTGLDVPPPATTTTAPTTTTSTGC
jgi:hypothetical protein